MLCQKMLKCSCIEKKLTLMVIKCIYDCYSFVQKKFKFTRDTTGVCCLTYLIYKMGLYYINGIIYASFTKIYFIKQTSAYN